MNREFFGLPVYAWAAGLGAFALGVFAFMRHRSTGNTASAPTAPPVNVAPSTGDSSAPTVGGGTLPVPYSTSGGYLVDPGTGEIIADTTTGTPISTIPAPANPGQNLQTQMQQLQEQLWRNDPAHAVWHFGDKTPQTKWWRWVPSVAAQFGLPSGPQDSSSTPDPSMLAAQGRWPNGVPLAYSWQYGDVDLTHTPIDASGNGGIGGFRELQAIPGYVPALHG